MVHRLDFDLGLHRLAAAAVPGTTEVEPAPTLWRADRFWSAAAAASRFTFIDGSGRRSVFWRRWRWRRRDEVATCLQRVSVLYRLYIIQNSYWISSSSTRSSTLPLASSLSSPSHCCEHCKSEFIIIPKFSLDRLLLIYFLSYSMIS